MPLHCSAVACDCGPSGLVEHVALPPEPHTTVPVPQAPMPSHAAPSAWPCHVSFSSVWPSQSSSKPLQVSDLAWLSGPSASVEHVAVPVLLHVTTPGPQMPLPGQLPPSGMPR